MRTQHPYKNRCLLKKNRKVAISNQCVNSKCEFEAAKEHLQASLGPQAYCTESETLGTPQRTLQSLALHRGINFLQL